MTSVRFMGYKSKKGRSPKFQSPKKDLHRRFGGWKLLTVGMDDDISEPSDLCASGCEL
jgi:hypothetical protein